MVGKETSNAAGGRPPQSTPNSATSIDRSGLQPDSPPGTESDSALAAKARQQKGVGNNSGSRETIKEIKDPQKRQATQDELFGVNNSYTESPPVTLMQDGSGSLSDPLALFFMMVYYLTEAQPTFKWDDVLKTAAGFSNQTFNAIRPTDGILPQRQFANSGVMVVSSGAKGEIAASEKAAREEAEKEKAANDKALQAERDKATQAMNSERGAAGTTSGRTGQTVIWPIQCMPIIAGGLNKSVDWPTTTAPTFAEPQVVISKGGTSIEIDVEFTYAVGIYGVGDGEISAMTGNIDPISGQPNDSTELPAPPDPSGKWWTIEEVMGMMYLATSLIYPFKSNPVTSQGLRVEPNTQAQYPVVFMRHYSLFPFLTPFVVKAVRIEPDENQPLIITEAVNLNRSFKTHLTYPAVRQVVKITLSLISAHYYLPMFGNGKDENNQMQQQTSGETYLKLSKSLLDKRIP